MSNAYCLLIIWSRLPTSYCPLVPLVIGALKMKLNQNIFWQVKIGFRFFLVTIFGIQCVLSFVKLMSGGRDLVHLTFIDSGNNEEYRHPLYTVKNWKLYSSGFFITTKYFIFVGLCRFVLSLIPLATSLIRTWRSKMSCLTHRTIQQLSLSHWRTVRSYVQRSGQHGWRTDCTEKRLEASRRSCWSASLLMSLKPLNWVRSKARYKLNLKSLFNCESALAFLYFLAQSFARHKRTNALRLWYGIDCQGISNLHSQSSRLHEHFYAW